MKYDVILMDPPWDYRVYSKDTGSGRSAESHYRTMRLKDIQELPVKDIAEKDCALFLWVTMPNLVEGIETIEKLGFKYKTCAFTWIKTNIKAGSLFWGLGFWTRANAELCLLATRGNPHRVDKGVHSVVMSPVRSHSAKPVEVHRRIERLMGPDVKKIELFARVPESGWRALGNEIDGMDMRDALPMVSAE